MNALAPSPKPLGTPLPPSPTTTPLSLGSGHTLKTVVPPSLVLTPLTQLVLDEVEMEWEQRGWEALSAVMADWTEAERGGEDQNGIEGSGEKGPPGKIRADGYN